MKCIKTKKGDIRRVSNEQAKRAVSTGKANYVPKSEWKEKVRDAGKA
jgi:hypothetical protein